MAKRKQPEDPSRPKPTAAISEDDLTHKNVRAIARLEERAKNGGRISGRIADAVSAFAGSMTFVWINVIWFTGWILYNSLSASAFDPFPFTFLTLMVSLEAILLSIFILISQNRETALAQRRNHLDLQINLLSEQENTQMLQYLEAIAGKIGAELPSGNGAQDLTKDIDPESVMRHIVREMETGSNA